jgi:hypothetical protein
MCLTYIVRDPEHKLSLSSGCIAYSSFCQNFASEIIGGCLRTD